MVAQTPISTRTTAAEFALLPESSERVELIHGELVYMPTPKDAHQTVVLMIALLLTQITAGRGKVKISPLDVYFDDENVLQPDVFWVSGPESKCQLGADDYWHGAPDLVVEVLSPSTAKHDKEAKFAIYQQTGVREYWIADPANRYIEPFALQNSTFASLGTFILGEMFTSPVLGQAVDISLIFG